MNMQQGNSGGETKKDFIQKYVFNNIGIKTAGTFFCNCSVGGNCQY